MQNFPMNLDRLARRSGDKDARYGRQRKKTVHPKGR